MSILGNRVIRREDPALLCGQGTFVDDLDIPGAAWVTYVRSPIAHARITAVELEAARVAPGVIDVLSAEDLPLGDLVPFGRDNHPMSRPLLARDVVRFAGEPVVAVVTELQHQGPDAAELVWIDYEPLPAVTNPEAAASAAPIFQATDSNVCARLEPGTGRRSDTTASFEGCEVTVELSTVSQRVAACPIEARVAAARWEGGRLVVHISCQGVHPVRETIAAHYGLDPSQVRVICPDVGGSFGAKADVYPEQLLLPELARRNGRPVRWSETRSENMVAMSHGRGQAQRITIGGRRDGTIEAYRLEVCQDAGAYPTIGASLPFMTRMMLTGVYTIPRAEFRSESVVTNTTPTAAYRGAGRPEAASAIERAVDRFATEIGLDPLQVRLKNLVPAEAFPYTTAMGTVYDSGRYREALETVADAAGYAKLRSEQKQRRDRADRMQIGIGLSCYVEITAIGAGGEFGSVELQRDGTVLARTGSNPYGQGHHTAWAMIISDRLGMPMDRIRVVHGDTDLVPEGSITGGSRSAQLAGSAMLDAAAKLVEGARGRAAELLEAAVEDIVHDRREGRFHVAGSPAVSVGWDEVARAPGPALGATSDFEAEASTFPFGAHLAVVEVDVETGAARLVRHVACDDAGRIINELLVEGQVHGGIAQGAAQALLEEVRYDSDGNPLTTNFADYAVVSAAELPSFERVPMETPTPLNPLGAKGIGESGTIGSTPAVQNAVVDAVAHLGVRHVDMPCTPEKVWRAIEAARPA